MTKSTSLPGMALASLVLLAGALPAMATITPALQISDGTYTITVDGSGNVTQSANCTASTCTATVSVAPGTVTYSGTIGNFVITDLNGTSKGSVSLAALQPAMDVGIASLQNTGSGTGVLTVLWTDIGFSGIDPTTISPATTYLNGAATTDYKLYVDNTNAVFGTGTLSTSLLGQGSGAGVTASGAGITANPFSMTLSEAITLGGNGVYTNDYGAKATPGSITVVNPPSPKITLTKSLVGPAAVSPFTKVTYNYLVTNTGTAPVTNLVVTDDNATPTYSADDFTATCPTTTLAVGASVTCTATVYPPVTYGANDCAPGTAFNYSSYHPGGTLICKNLPNGDLQFHWLIDEDTTDNTFGTGASATWPSGSSSSWLANSTSEFQIYDAKGNKVLDFVSAYVGYNPSLYYSGWGSGGVQSVISGNGAYIVSSDTTGSRNLNQSKAFAQCLSNSPTQNVHWVPQCGYIVEVKPACWGSNGFGRIECPSLNNEYTKSGKCSKHVTEPVNSTDTNTAVATAVYNGTTVTSNSSTATVTIDVNPKVQCPVPLPPTCNIYGKAHNKCVPKGSGNDHNGYAYCDDLLPKTLTCDNTSFNLGSGNDRCAASGGSIPLPSGQYSTLKFLGSGTNGAQYGQPFTITYTDGSTSTSYQNLSDWCAPQNFAGETTAVSMPYRITPNGGQQNYVTNLYEYKIQCNNTKTVKSITLPGNSNVVVHSITMCP